MNIQSITIVSLRLLALYWGLAAVSDILPILKSLLDFIARDIDDADAIYKLAMPLLWGVPYLVGCLVLWPLAPKISKLICKGFTSKQTPETELNTHNIQIAALSVLGFFILSSAIPTLIQILSVVLYPALNSNWDTMFYGLENQKKVLIPWDNIIYLVVRLALGIWLIIGAAGIQKTVQKIRSVGRQAI